MWICQSGSIDRADIMQIKVKNVKSRMHLIKYAELNSIYIYRGP